jgi:lysozyme
MKRIYEKAAIAVAGIGLRRIAAVMTLSVAGASGIVYHEGTVGKVYLDPVGIPTVCVGHTRTVTKADVGKDMSAQCAQLLVSDTKAAQSAVGRLVLVPVTQAQYDALVSFTFNVGEGNLRSSTLLLKLNSYDCHGAAAEFPRWNKARGKVLPGLVKRRADERITFEQDC